MAVVEFDIEEFRTQFPKFSDETKYSDEYLEGVFEQAVVIVGNDDATSLAPYDPPKVLLRKTLLYLATCHLATLDDNPDGVPGRVASASQGSVSTSFDLMRSNSNSWASQWWAQTQCGARFWLLTARFRTGGRIYPGPSNYHPW